MSRPALARLIPPESFIEMLLSGTWTDLNTHALSSLYQVYEPVEARRIARKLEVYYTPKHGSWLNMAESELSVVARQCLKRRLASEEESGRGIAAWTKACNGREATVEWRFTTDDTRIKLRRLYSSIQRGHSSSPKRIMVAFPFPFSTSLI
jgi:hypothetical protein